MKVLGFAAAALVLGLAWMLLAPTEGNRALLPVTPEENGPAERAEARPEVVEKGGTTGSRLNLAPVVEEVSGDSELGAWRVTGVTVRPSGLPVARAEVHLSSGSWGQWDTTDAEGKFEIEIPEPGTYVCRAEAQGVGRALEQTFAVSEDSLDLGQVILWGSGVLAGRTVFRDGTPAGDVPLTMTLVAAEGGTDSAKGIQRALVSSDSAGHFRVEGLAVGTYRFAGPSGLSGPGQVFYDTDNLDVVIQLASRRLTVHIQDPNGRPSSVSDFRLYQRTGNPEFPFEQVVQILNVAERSTFRLWIDPPGDYLVRVENPMGKRRGEAEISIGPHEMSPERVVVIGQVSRSGSLVVHVRDSAGREVSPNLVELYAGVGGDWISTHSLSSGERIEGLVEGRYRLVIRPGIAGPAQLSDYLESELPLPVVVQAGQEASATLQARAGGRVELRLEGAEEGDAGTKAKVWVRRGTEEWQEVSWRLEVEKGYSLKRSLDFGDRGILQKPLEPGHYELEVRAPGYRDERQSVRVRAGELTKVRVSMAPE